MFCHASTTLLQFGSFSTASAYRKQCLVWLYKQFSAMPQHVPPSLSTTFELQQQRLPLVLSREYDSDTADEADEADEAANQRRWGRSGCNGC